MGALTDPIVLAIKAALTASIAILLTHLLDVPDQLSAGFVAVACVTPTAYAGLKRGGQQIVGSLIGGGIAMVLVLALPARVHAPWIVLLSVLLSILACTKLGMGSAYGVAAFSVVYVVALPFSSVAVAVETRLESLAIGIGVATLTNLGVSAAFGDRIVERRMRLARARVMETLRRRADVDAEARFEEAFAVVAELRTDLEAAHRELFARRARRSAERHLAESIRLRRLLHGTKTLVLLGHTTTSASVVDAAIAKLAGGELDEPTVDAVFAELGPPQSEARRF